MKKAFLEQLNKFKSHFDKDKESSKKDKKFNTDSLIDQFRDLSKYCLPPQELNSLDYYYRTYPKPNENPIIFVSVVAFHHKKGSIVL